MSTWRAAAHKAARTLAATARARVLAAWEPEAQALEHDGQAWLGGTTVWLGTDARRESGRWTVAPAVQLCKNAIKIRAERAHARWVETLERCAADAPKARTPEWDESEARWRQSAREEAQRWVSETTGGRATLESVLERYWQATRGGGYPALALDQIKTLKKLDASAWRRLEAAPAWLARAAARWLDAEQLEGEAEQWAQWYANAWIERVTKERRASAREVAGALEGWQWDSVAPPLGLMALLESEGLEKLEEDAEIDGGMTLDLQPETLAGAIEREGLPQALAQAREALAGEISMDDALERSTRAWAGEMGADAGALEAMRAQWAREDALEGDGRRTRAALAPVKGQEQVLGWRWRIDGPEHLIGASILGWDDGAGRAGSAGAAAKAGEIAERYQAVSAWSTRARGLSWVHEHTDAGAGQARARSAERVLRAR